MQFTSTASTALRVLQVPLRAVLPFLQGGLRSAGEQRRNSTVVRSLRRAENLQVREELIRCRQRCVAPAGTCLRAEESSVSLSCARQLINQGPTCCFWQCMACSSTEVLLARVYGPSGAAL